MDTKPVVIGSKSRYARPQKTKTDPRSILPDLVDVYAGEEYVETVKERVLTRFSTKARQQLPRIERDAKKVTESAEAKTEDQVPAGFEVVGSKKGKGKATGSSLPLITDAPSTPSPVSSAKTNRTVTFTLPEYLLPPSVGGITQCLRWMDTNQHIHGKDQQLHDFPAPTGPQFPFEKLIELYATTIAIDVRPPPHKLRGVIMDRLTTSAPLVDEVQAVFDRLPIFLRGSDKRDCVYTRLVTSCIEYAGKDDGYSVEEWDAIMDYVELPENHELKELFESIIRSRARGPRQPRMPKSSAGVKKMMDEGLAAFAGISIDEVRTDTPQGQKDGMDKGGKAAVKKDVKEDVKAEVKPAVKVTINETAMDDVKETGGENVKKDVKVDTKVVTGDHGKETPSSPAAPGGRQRHRRAQKNAGAEREAAKKQ